MYPARRRRVAEQSRRSSNHPCVTLYRYVHDQNLHSFPTHSSSDLEGWISPTNQAAHPIVDWSPNGTNGTQHGTTRATGQYRITSAAKKKKHLVQTAEGLIALNVFQHFALTYDRASGVARVFLNGSG